ncbi:MAG: HD domain-containing protein [Lachnospiraceae bacterium]|nr:HD domain-containing protein [Lachnospiraceae bacterium]MDD7079009.1 HD domain-containing protein [Lachnospiraceae bacterium]MDY3729744.1 HD domain-containing phosphohydrolase [Candidatus Choladocola sp.]
MSEKGREYRKKYPIIRPSVIKELAHGMTVSNLAYLVGKQMNFSEEDCHDLALAGFLHDIGKLELVKYVRDHEGETLVIEEMKYVRRHPRLGAEILEKKGYSQKIVDMVKFHHENCDGSGYPMNLSREDIPIGSRIIRVCDVFAALTNDRPYRKAFDIQTAMKLMIEESKDYDVQVFLAFMNVVHHEDVKKIVDTSDFEEKMKTLIAEDPVFPAMKADRV